MEVREIKALLALMQDFGLIELEIEDKKGKVRLVRAAATAPSAPAAAIPHSAAPKASAPAPRGVRKQSGATTDGARGSEPPVLTDNQKLIESPMVGTFYRAPSPDADPFVDEGDSVRKGQTLCIIEAMKMMNEIDSDAAGRVVKILCENGQPIEYGQPLMILELG